MTQVKSRRETAEEALVAVRRRMMRLTSCAGVAFHGNHMQQNTHRVQI